MANIVNHENMTKLANFLNGLEDDRLQMGYWVSDIDEDAETMDLYIQEGELLDVNLCHTAGCIAGWSVCLENGGVLDVHYGENFDDENMGLNAADISRLARVWLGLSYEAAQSLFIPDRYSLWHKHASDLGIEPDVVDASPYYSTINPKAAAKLLFSILNDEIELPSYRNGYEG